MTPVDRRQLIEEGHLLPDYFYEAGYQSHLTSPVEYEYLPEMALRGRTRSVQVYRVKRVGS